MIIKKELFLTSFISATVGGILGFLVSHKLETKKSEDNNECEGDFIIDMGETARSPYYLAFNHSDLDKISKKRIVSFTVKTVSK